MLKEADRYKRIDVGVRGERWMKDRRLVKADTVPEEIKQLLRGSDRVEEPAKFRKPNRTDEKTPFEGVNQKADKADANETKCAFGHKTINNICTWQYCPYYRKVDSTSYVKVKGV